MSKNLKKKYKLNNFVAQPGESMISYLDIFIDLMRGVPNHHICDDSFKKYFHRGKDDNGKKILDTLAGGSYGECLWEKITKKMENIYRNKKSWSTIK